MSAKLHVNAKENALARQQTFFVRTHANVEPQENRAKTRLGEVRCQNVLVWLTTVTMTPLYAIIYTMQLLSVGAASQHLSSMEDDIRELEVSVSIGYEIMYQLFGTTGFN